MKVPGGRPRRKGPSAEEIAAGKREGLSVVLLEDMTDKEVYEESQRRAAAGETEHAKALQKYLDAGRPPQELDRIQAVYEIVEDGEKDIVLVGDMTHAALLAEAARLKTLASAATKPAATAEWKHATQLEQVAAWKLKVTPAVFDKVFGRPPGPVLKQLADEVIKRMKRDGVLEELAQRPGESEEQYIARLEWFVSRQGRS